MKKISQNRIFRRLYQYFNRVIPCDISGIWMLELVNLRNPGTDCSDFIFRFLDPVDVIRFASKSSSGLTAEMAKLIDQGEAVCFAAVFQDKLAAYSWFAKGRVAPMHNSGGGRFNGIGLNLNDDYIYLFKALVLPEFRGNALNGWIYYLAGRKFVEDSVKYIITTTDCTNYAFQRSVEKGGFEQFGVAVEWILGNKHHYLFPRLSPDKPTFFQG